MAELVPLLPSSQLGVPRKNESPAAGALPAAQKGKRVGWAVAGRWEENSGQVMGRVSKLGEWWSVLLLSHLLPHDGCPLRLSASVGSAAARLQPSHCCARSRTGTAAWQPSMNQTPKPDLSISLLLFKAQARAPGTQRNAWEEQSTVKDSEPGCQQRESKPDYFTNIIMRYKAALFCSGRRWVGAA